MNAFNRALLRKDYYTETYQENKARNEYYEAKADEDEKGFLTQLATQLVGATIGFIFGGPPGASIGWNVGSPVGRQIQKNRPGYFEANKALMDDVFTTGGKFNSRMDKEWAKTERKALRDEEEAAVISDVLSIGKSTWTFFDTDFDKDFGPGGKYEGWGDWGKKGDKWNLKSRSKAMTDYYKTFDIRDFLQGSENIDKDINTVVKISEQIMKDDNVASGLVDNVKNKIADVTDNLEFNDTKGIINKWLKSSKNAKEMMKNIDIKDILSNAKEGLVSFFTPVDAPKLDTISLVDEQKFKIPESPFTYEDTAGGYTTTLVKSYDGWNVPEGVGNIENNKIVDNATKSVRNKKKSINLSFLNPFKDRDIIDWDSLFNSVKNPNPITSPLEQPVMTQPDFSKFIGGNATDSMFNVETVSEDNSLMTPDINTSLDTLSNINNINEDTSNISFDDMSQNIPSNRLPGQLAETKLHDVSIAEEVMLNAREAFENEEQIDSYAEYDRIISGISRDIGLPKGININSVNWKNSDETDKLPFKAVLKYFQSFSPSGLDAFKWKDNFYDFNGKQLNESYEMNL